MYKLFCLPNTNFSIRKFFIRNTELPLCLNCLHFIDNNSYNPKSTSKQYGKCKKFGKMYLITGIIEYDFARHCRADNGKCGKIGSEYREKIKS